MRRQWQAAFGVAPAISLPAGSLPAGADTWAHAVDLGARGRAAAARAVLDEVIGDPGADAAVCSLAFATRASLTRQAGRHAVARADDGRAARIAFAGEQAASVWTRAARVDALVGLAADSLGIGYFGASSRLLERAGVEIGAGGDVTVDAGAEVGGGEVDWGEVGWVCDGRPRLRIAWVRAELALYSGDPRAAEFAARAVELAADAPSLRHRVKTDLIAAASHAAAGESAVAADSAERIAATCRGEGLLPLEWAAQTMVEGLRPGVTASRPAAGLQAVLVTRGMAFAPLAGPSDPPRYP